jgi:RNA polymerase sigma-70 factor (ECF subfamily)
MLALPMTLNTTAETETETAKIARGLRERDMELLGDLVERCQHRLVRYLLYLTGRREYAEDLAQETWIRVLQRGSQYNGRQRFDPWLFAIARNLAIDYLRKKRKAVASVSLPNDRDAVLFLPSSDPSPFEAAARSEDAMRLAGRLQILPPLYREALLLRFQEDLSLAEMAQVLGAPTTTVTSRIYRGLAALRSAFEEGDSHGG